MIDVLIQLAPIFLYFGLGILLRAFSVADKSHGEFLLRLVFTVTLPLLILSSLSGISFSLDKAVLPFANIAVNMACMLTTLIVIKLMSLDRKTSGTMLVNTMITNNVYMFPFILTIFGEAGFADAILFDFGNALLMATYVYALAFRYGDDEQNSWFMLLKMFKSPLIWALLLAVILSLAGIGIPEAVLAVVEPMGQMTSPLILIALGIFFSLNMVDLKLVSLTIFIRMGMGLLFGIAIANYLGLQGVTFMVVSLCAAAPVGFNALTLTSMAKLDTALSSSTVSLSILLGMIYIPILIIFFGAG